MKGRKYACESVSGMMKYAFSVLHVRRIFAEINARNDKSIQLAERLGMRKEAEHKELYPRKEDKNSYDDFCVSSKSARIIENDWDCAMPINKCGGAI